MNADFIGLSPPKAARTRRDHDCTFSGAFVARARLFMLLAAGARIMTTFEQGHKSRAM
jgi:hypothetical protein